MWMYVLACNGIQGARFDNRDDAITAAELRHNLDGRNWTIRKIWVKWH